MVEKLSSWIRQQVESAKVNGIVVGMSGGIDSSVVAVLVKRAMGKDMLGVYMPCYSRQEDREDALLVAKKFDIPLREVVLDGVFDAFLKAVGIDGKDVKENAVINIKPRLRMAVLYHIANLKGYMVAGTGNRSELEVGYFTKYGDGGVDMLPIGCLVKHEVKAVAEYLGIPEKIIDKPPSAGLWEEQTDEGEMGITYEELDRYILGLDVSGDVKVRIERLKAKNMHKRSAVPVCKID
ncbi:MAG: NAD(+) synthase [Synergistetes bacterium]|nr:NAD(+) synthase [Synergistota bacterium]